MYRIIRCEKDTYITDRVIGYTSRATDANVGNAATLDLFKLYDESNLSGSSAPIELSRLLVKFDTASIRALTSSIDIADDSFKAYLVLTDVVGGQPTPSNFAAVIHSLSHSWDEGVGRDVVRFSDIDVANWITASVSPTFIPWFTSGASAEGPLGAANIDVIGSGNLNDGLGFRFLFKEQSFTSGDEDLEVDVTDLVSATLTGQIPDHGFRISFTGSIETSTNTLFVKRFASRHASDPTIRPKLIITYDDSVIDNHGNFTFDSSGSLYLFNVVRGASANIVSGAAATQLTGSSCMILKLISGSISPVTSQSFSASYDVHQYARGSMNITGAYYATFAVSSFDSRLTHEIMTAGSATFHAIWGSRDGTVAYRTGSLVIRTSETSARMIDGSHLNVTLSNCRQSYSRSSRPRIRVNVYNELDMRMSGHSKLPFRQRSMIIERMYWRIVDIYSGDVIIPFGDDDQSTRLSVDDDGMYFDFFPGDLHIGRTFGFEFMIIMNGQTLIIDSNLPTFTIEP